MEYLSLHLNATLLGLRQASLLPKKPHHITLTQKHSLFGIPLLHFFILDTYWNTALQFNGINERNESDRIFFHLTGHFCPNVLALESWQKQCAHSTEAAITPGILLTPVTHHTGHVLSCDTLMSSLVKSHVPPQKSFLF